MMPAWYLMGAAVIGLITVFFMRESARKPLHGSAPAVASEAEAESLIKKIKLRRQQKNH